MKNILVLVRGYHPDLSASGNLIKPLIYELGRKNKVHILSCSAESYMEVITDNITSQKIKITPLHSSFTKRIVLFLKRQFINSSHNKEIVATFQKTIVKLDKKKNFDLIIAITYEEILALLSISIPKNKKNVFLLEKLPISSNIPVISNLKLLYKKRIELKIMEESSKVYALPIMYKYLIKSNKEHKSKLVELEHPMITNRVSAPDNNKEITLIYAGGLDKKQRNPTNLIIFLKKINLHINIKLVIYSYGNTQKILNGFSKDNNFITTNNAIDSLSLEKEISKSNFIITIGNKESDIVPSKIFDCLSTGKPILHFSQVEDDPYFDYLERYNNSLILKYNNHLSSDTNILKTIDFIKNNKNTIISYPVIEKTFKECTPEYVAKQIIF